MGKQIIIGRQGNQPFAIGDPKVSSRHASLSVDDYGHMILIDNNSTNGTYIYNGATFERIFPNQPYQVTGDSMIQLGPDTRFHVRRLLNLVVNGAAASQQPVQKSAGQAPKQPPKPERVNIKSLRVVSENYSERKMQLDSKSGMINNLRSCTILISMVAGSTGPLVSQITDMDKSKTIVLSLITVGVAAVLMTILLVLISKFSKKIMREKAAIEKQYAIKYCCPKCKKPFKGLVYENILAEGKCPKCKAEFYEA